MAKIAISNLLVTCTIITQLSQCITTLNVKNLHVQTKRMYSLIKADDLLEKYNTIWDKVSADTKK